MTAPDLDALAALLDKATPGPYYWFMRECANKNALMVELAAVVDKTVAVNGYNLHGVGVGDPEPDADYLAVAHTGCGPRSPINAQLIVAALNALPALLAYVRELEAGRDSARDEETGRALTAWQWKVRYQDCEMSYRNASATWNTHTNAAALAMRERAAQACEVFMHSVPDAGGDDLDRIARYSNETVRRCAAAIRALEP